MKNTIVNLTASQIESVKDQVKAVSPWTKRAWLRWSFEAYVNNSSAAGDRFGTTVVRVNIGKSNWTFIKFGLADQVIRKW